MWVLRLEKQMLLLLSSCRSIYLYRFGQYSIDMTDSEGDQSKSLL